MNQSKHEIQQDLHQFNQQMTALSQRLAGVVLGQENVIEALLICLVAGGHCLLEGVPGLGKTLLMRALARGLDLSFKRIQFTPDLMPADIIGSEMIEQQPGSQSLKLAFVPGPIFCQLLLADEINRTPPKTQAALLEAMSEHAVTVAGKQHRLGPPFMVLATQNPIEQSGTYDLPEAQLDRFMMCVQVSYPSREQEIVMLSHRSEQDLDKLQPLLDADQINRFSELCTEVFVDTSIQAYIIDLARQTRPETTGIEAVRQQLKAGVSPRAAMALQRACQARALIAGRLAVVPDDIRALVPHVWGHRLLFDYQSMLGAVNSQSLLDQIMAQTPLP